MDGYKMEEVIDIFREGRQSRIWNLSKRDEFGDFRLKKVIKHLPRFNPHNEMTPFTSDAHNVVRRIICINMRIDEEKLVNQTYAGILKFNPEVKGGLKMTFQIDMKTETKQSMGNT